MANNFAVVARPPELLHPLTSVRRRIFLRGEENTVGTAAGGGEDRRDFPSTAYQTLQGFPFRPPAEFLQPAGNVKRKFRSFEINSAPRDCAAFTRLEYLASGRYSQSRYQSFRILQRQSRNVSYWANETGKGEYPIFRPRFILRYERFLFVA